MTSLTAYHFQHHVQSYDRDNWPLSIPCLVSQPQEAGRREPEGHLYIRLEFGWLRARFLSRGDLFRWVPVLERMLAIASRHTWERMGNAEFVYWVRAFCDLRKEEE